MSDGHALMRRPSDAGRGARPAPFPAPAHGTSIARMRQAPALPVEHLDQARVIHDEMDDPRTADLMRELRTRLLFDAPVANPVILVCGARHGCGASYVARNLAAAIALDETRTALLVDCNLRRPSVGRLLDAGDGPGLADYLRTPSMGVEAIIHPTGLPRLRVLPAGHAGVHAGEQLAGLRMRALLDEVHGRYPDRCVVLDAPPARGAPEARVLAERADLVLLVAGEGMHTTDDLLEAARLFDPARFAGIVYNELP